MIFANISVDVALLTFLAGHYFFAHFFFFFFSSKLWVASTLHAIITSFLVAFELDPYNAYAFTTPLLRPYETKRAENVVAAVCPPSLLFSSLSLLALASNVFDSPPLSHFSRFTGSNIGLNRRTVASKVGRFQWGFFLHLWFLISDINIYIYI